MAEPAKSDPKKPLPPYIAFKTLTDLIERMEREEPPTRVDPSYLDSYAGGYRPTVISNLQTMGLLNKDFVPTDELKALVAGTEADRKRLIAELVGRLYTEVLALGMNSTQGQFLEAFSSLGAHGDTRRKAVAFFLKAAKYGGVETGTHWKTPPASTNGAIRRRTTKLPKPEENNEDFSHSGAGGEATPGEIVMVDLGGAGRVTVHVDVKWLQLDEERFIKLRKAVNDLKVLAAASQPTSESSQESEECEDEGGAP